MAIRSPDVRDHLTHALSHGDLDRVASLLGGREGVAFRTRFEVAGLPLLMAVIAGIAPDRCCEIGFDRSIVGGAHAGRLTGALMAAATLLARASADPAVPSGQALFTLADGAGRPGLGFCSARPRVKLVPDPRYVLSDGYTDLRAQFDTAWVPWESRAPLAFWRGSTTGVRARPERHWRSLPRIALCDMSLRYPGHLDAGISGVAQARTATEAAEIEAAGLCRASVPATRFMAYRYQVDIDGNTNAWSGLFTKLLSGSSVLKVASPSGYRQWYYDRLVAWENYVPVRSDLSDLVAAIDALRADDARARAIGEAGRRLALSLDPDTEIPGSAVSIRDAFTAARE